MLNWNSLSRRDIRLTAFVALCMPFVWAVSQAEEIYGQPDAPLVAEVLGTKIHTSDLDEMQYVILSKLTDRYATERGIQVKREEIDAYIETIRRFMEKDRKQSEARREQIARKLDAKDLPAEERKRLSAERDRLNELLAAQEEAAGGAAENPEEDKTARDRIASSFIRQFKINRALYEQYGGRIAFQQGGPEPLDAYRKFLKEQEKQGAFKILKKEFEPKFWRYYVTDSIHSFYPPGSKEEAQAFQTPQWLSD
ncbi:MAG: hypothetical protein U9Q81_19810 [Pseudomonadota bacterium]|nr:hypothetical protein [Pseudomonadota bacterium]